MSSNHLQLFLSSLLHVRGGRGEEEGRKRSVTTMHTTHGPAAILTLSHSAWRLSLSTVEQSNWYTA